jgi:sec-independent protein translocase protein TatA
MGNLGPTEIILILLVVVLLFGAKKLPELARGSGRALRIFKSETKGLMDDEKSHDPHEADTDAHGRPLPSGTDYQRPTTYRAEPVDPTSDPAARPSHDQR